ncbi:MAG: DinB family protein [Flammeovirgaceae bacterium]|nr:DinB family protein [Flammeovirgaceae bacterium]
MNRLTTCKDGKWSIAHNIEHLILSAKPVSLAFSLPKFLLRFFGKPNRAGRVYDEVVNRYLQRLDQGGKAPAQFIPSRKIKTREVLLDRFQRAHEKLVKNISGHSEADLDRYVLPHPLLGKLLLREMCFFTIYHIHHHHNAIKKQI